MSGHSSVQRDRVTVVIAAYNAAATIGAAISGVLHQTYQDVELIVVDDGSTDETAVICAAYGDRLKLISTENGGPARARNLALAHATGEYIAICDADDQLLPPAVERSLSRLHSEPGRTIVTNEAYLMSTEGMSHGRLLLRGSVPPRRKQRIAILERNFVGIFCIFPRQLLDEVGVFNADYRQLEDWELWIRAVYCNWRIVEQRDPVAVYRLTVDSLSTLGDRFEVELRMLESFEEANGRRLSTSERAYLRRRLSRPSLMELRQSGALALRESRWNDAQQLHADVAALAKTDTMVRTKAFVVARVPGAARVVGLRERWMVRRLGGRVTDATASEGVCLNDDQTS